ncbi:hypothetical protein SAMN05444266_1127 [Chitinophaga jiangningensis]|uniref:DUF1440 domain-containing protein n=1 Tax=Chitinophaga jiangningensis TaxID=1419482 RepID=A0A1M7M265_9BACT|nr:hypothetical protein [Chitinophaga jiangningensis]SHM84267.1 hypothetical protein SAMN05444266_1127 [Chitinophaga jiangningensis]
MEATRQYNKFTTGTIALTALLAGTLDLATSCILFTVRSGKSFVEVLKFIASALLGPAAYSGNPAIPWLGVLFHYAIAFVFTTFFFLVYPFIRKGIRNTFLIAIIYGLFVWVVMNVIVLPFTHVKQIPFTTFGVSVGALVLIIMIGLPLAIVAERVSEPEKK